MFLVDKIQDSMTKVYEAGVSSLVNKIQDSMTKVYEAGVSSCWILSSTR